MLPELSGARSVAPQAKTFGAMSFLQPIRSCFVSRVFGRLAGHLSKMAQPKGVKS